MKIFTSIEFIEKANVIHNYKYNYNKFVYINSRTKGIIICKKHNVEFLQTPQAHLRGCGCRICAVQDVSQLKFTTDYFVKRANIVHNNIYDYSLVEYKGDKQKVKIICNIHGLFFQTPNSHITGRSGCPICKLSKGELKIKKFLDDKYIRYFQQYRFENCRGTKYALPFDFYLPDHNICIEYDGEQHFKGWFKYRDKETENIIILNKTQLNDNIKTNYCKLNNLILIRIPYFDINNIEKILNTVII